MRLKTVLVLVLLWMLPGLALAADGLVVKPSPYDVVTTVDRLEAKLQEKGIRTLARINHSKNAETVGLSLRDVELLIFGNPKLGTPLMQSNPTVAIDLPMKIIVWKDEGGKVWLGYNNPSYIAKRHNVDDKQAVIDKMSGALGKITDAATAR